MSYKCEERAPIDDSDLSVIVAVRCYGMNRDIQDLLLLGKGKIRHEEILYLCGDPQSVHAHAMTFNDVFLRRRMPYFLERMIENKQVVYHLFKSADR